MPKVPSKILFENCYGNYAIAAVNIFTMEQVLGLFSASASSGTPVIVQITPAARNYAGAEMLMAMVQSASLMHPEALYTIHMDHGTEDHILDALNKGYDSVMIDASHDDFETNIRRTAAIVKKAHAKNISVEAELGILSGVEDDISIDESYAKYTNPEQAKEFVQRTGCDSLAVAVGTSHGAYKFSGGKGLQFEVLKKIQQQLPAYPLVLHGSSGVKRTVTDAINRLGGKLAGNASGVTDEEIQKAIQFGICKVNIATDLRLLWTLVHRRFFVEQPSIFDPVIPGKMYMKEYEEFMIDRFEVLQSKGKSNSIKLN
jgi:fructose-bisphosphate aldolase class II